MEVNNVIVEDCGYPILERSKDLRGKTPHKYDGTKPLPDPMQEEYIHKIIMHMGDRRKAYEEVFHPNVTAPNYAGRAPYRFFERKGFMQRYKYLMDQAMYSTGLDKKTLLLKAAHMMDKAVKGNKVRDFTSLVDTVLKLQVDDTKYKALAGKTQEQLPSAADLKPVEDLMKSLNI